MFDKTQRFLNIVLIVIFTINAMELFIFHGNFLNGAFFACLALTFNEVRLLTNKVADLTQELDNVHDVATQED